MKTKSGKAWAELLKSYITIMDPDGWDRAHFAVSFLEQLTLEEFKTRCEISTCCYKHGTNAFYDLTDEDIEEMDTYELKKAES